MGKARYFYYIPEGMKIINFAISPGHYGRSLKSINYSYNKLFTKIEKINDRTGDDEDFLENVKYFSSNDAKIEIGASRWDKSVVRVTIQVTILKPINVESVEAAGFSPYPSDFNCY